MSSLRIIDRGGFGIGFGRDPESPVLLYFRPDLKKPVSQDRDREFKIRYAPPSDGDSRFGTPKKFRAKNPTITTILGPLAFGIFIHWILRGFKFLGSGSFPNPGCPDKMPVQKDWKDWVSWFLD